MFQLLQQPGFCPETFTIPVKGARTSLMFTGYELIIKTTQYSMECHTRTNYCFDPSLGLGPLAGEVSKPFYIVLHRSRINFLLTHNQSICRVKLDIVLTESVVKMNFQFHPSHPTKFHVFDVKKLEYNKRKVYIQADIVTTEFYFLYYQVPPLTRK